MGGEGFKEGICGCEEMREGKGEVRAGEVRE